MDLRKSMLKPTTRFFEAKTFNVTKKTTFKIPNYFVYNNKVLPLVPR